VGAAADGATRATEQQQHDADDHQDEADRPQDRDCQQQSEYEKNKSEDDHAWRIPALFRVQTCSKVARAEEGFSVLQDLLNWSLAS